jgi:hypothetical protein
MYQPLFFDAPIIRKTTNPTSAIGINSVAALTAAELGAFSAALIDCVIGAMSETKVVRSSPNPTPLRAIGPALNIPINAPYGKTVAGTKY